MWSKKYTFYWEVNSFKWSQERYGKNKNIEGNIMKVIYSSPPTSKYFYYQQRG